jgi:hypothetical protein
MGAKRTARKSLRQGEAVPTVNRLLRMTVGLFSSVTKRAVGMEAVKFGHVASIAFKLNQMKGGYKKWGL